MCLISRTYLLLLCAVLALTTGCTGNKTSTNEKEEVIWQRYNEAYHAKDLNRALSILDSMETEEIINTPKADYLRGLLYDQGWQMKIAEQLIRKPTKAMPQTLRRIGTPTPMPAIAGHVCA